MVPWVTVEGAQALGRQQGHPQTGFGITNNAPHATLRASGRALGGAALKRLKHAPTRLQEKIRPDSPDMAILPDPRCPRDPKLETPSDCMVYCDTVQGMQAFGRPQGSPRRVFGDNFLNCYTNGYSFRDICPSQTGSLHKLFMVNCCSVRLSSGRSPSNPVGVHFPAGLRLAAGPWNKQPLGILNRGACILLLHSVRTFARLVSDPLCCHVHIFLDGIDTKQT